MSSDDAATAEKGSCQIEAWHERTRAQRAVFVAPACGVSDDIELGLDMVRPSPRDQIAGAFGLATKWVPSNWRPESALTSILFV